jgi:hypothetical protein
LNGRQAEVAQLLRATGSALDDDEIAARLGMNRPYVNQICRRLAAQNLIRLMQGPGGKLINQAIDRQHQVGKDEACEHRSRALVDQLRGYGREVRNYEHVGPRSTRRHDRPQERGHEPDHAERSEPLFLPQVQADETKAEQRRRGKRGSRRNVERRFPCSSRDRSEPTTTRKPTNASTARIAEPTHAIPLRRLMTFRVMKPPFANRRFLGTAVAAFWGDASLTCSSPCVVSS